MKKIGIAVLGVLVATGLFFVFTSKNPNDALNKGVQTQVITLYRESGDVFYTNKEETEVQFDPNVTQVEVFSGSRVRTLEGSASILFPDNSMLSIDKNTTLTIEYSKEKVSILQTLGNTYHRVKTLESGQQYEVRAPGTLAAVRGTTFAVLLDPRSDNANIKVFENVVNVKKIDSTKTGEPITVLEEVDVPQGSQVDVPDPAKRITRKMVVATITKEDRQDGGFVERNQIIDEAVQNPNLRREFIEKMIEQAKGEKEGMTDKEKIEALRERVKQFKQEKNIEDKPVSEQNNTKVLVAKNVQPLPEKVPVTSISTSTPENTSANDDDNLPPLDPSRTEGSDPFILEFDRRYEYWFPIYSDKATLCSRVNPLTPEILRARLMAFETRYRGTVPNKDAILVFLRSAKAYCASTDTNNRVLDEGYTESYPF